MIKKIIFLIVIILFFTIIANATTYYVANNPCSGNAGWSNGSNSNDGLSKAAPFLTIVYSLGEMSSGDTLIIDDGTYTGANNKITRDGTQIPTGSIGHYTTVRAENMGQVILDAEKNYNDIIQIYGNETVDGETGTYGTREYIHVDGIICANSLYGNIVVGFADHIKITNCGAVDAGDGNVASVLSTYSTYVLFEGCYAWGNGRYKFSTFHSNKNVFRNCVSRFDRDDAQTDPMGDFSIYSSPSIEVQNCIAIDGDQRAYYLNADGDVGAFGCPNTTPIVETLAPVVFTNCIALNNERRFGSVDINSYVGQATWQNCVGWDIKASGTIDFMHVFGAATVENCTFGAVDTESGEDVTFAWINGWNGSANTDSYTDTIWYNFKNGGLFYDIETSNNNAIYGMDSGYSIDVNGTSSTNTKTYAPLTNGLLYLPRIESGSQLETDGIGANILKQYGKTGTHWGEAGYNLLQDGTNEQDDVDLWPFPNEDLIKTKMAAYTYDDGGGGDPEITGARGFCTGTSEDGSSQTLTKYIWEYLGNQIPAEIYGSETPAATHQCSGSFSGG